MLSYVSVGGHDKNVSFDGPREYTHMIVDRPIDWANIMRDRRLEWGFSQADLAARLGTSRQWVSGFESGKADKAPLSLALRIAAVLNIDVELVRPKDD